MGAFLGFEPQAATAGLVVIRVRQTLEIAAFGGERSGSELAVSQ
jgi:hypothetical protein